MQHTNVGPLCFLSILMFSFGTADAAESDDISAMASLCVVASVTAGQHADAMWWLRLTTAEQTAKAWDEYKDLIIESEPKQLANINAAYASAALTCKQLRNEAQ